MIRITCTHCRQVLTIDDGFAGGVCRCQHCGTIQTVPASPGKTKDRGAAPAAKTLYRSERRPQEQKHPGESHYGSGSGLDQLAEVVSSSGLHQSARMRSSAGGNGGPVPKPPVRRRSPWALIAAVAVVVALAVVVAILWMNRKPQPPAPINTPLPQAPVVAPVSGPNFAGMQIVAPDTVVYLVDNGGSATDTLPAMEAACFQSIKTLGSDHRFKMIFWRPDSPTYPPDDTVRATADEEAKCEAAVKDAYAQGSTQVDDALKAAIAAQADAVVLITGKADQLSDDFVQSVMSAHGDSHARIYTVGVNGDSSADPSKPGVLARIAQQTGGTFLNISSGDLERLGH